MSGPSLHPVRSRYDLVVVGGGIHGLFVANEAAMRGWAVALVERDDFGGGLSFNHQRTVHGGLRALESARFDKALTQIRERRAWAVMAPHLLRPLPFLLPTRTGGKRSRAVLGAGLRMYDWLGRGRNVSLPPSLHLPNSVIVGTDEVIRVFPGVDRSGLTGGARWYDYQVRHPDRLNWLVAQAAERSGAHLWNHVEATAAIVEHGKVAGVVVRDRLTGALSERRAPNVIVCAGGSVGAVHAAFGLPAGPPLLRACNVLVNRPAAEVALASVGASGRTLTATPWSDRWLIGTFQTAGPEDVTLPPRAGVDDMLADANAAFGLDLSRKDVLVVHAGLTPAVASRGRLELMPEHAIVDHSRHGRSGLFTLVGVKFTTARLAAIDALHRMRLAGRAGRSPDPVELPVQALPHGSSEGALAALQATALECNAAIDEGAMAHLVDWYGTEAPDVLRVAAEAGRLSRLSPASPVLDGEIVYAATRGAARRLSDAVLRRTRLGAAGNPGREALRNAAVVMSETTGWSETEREAEIDQVMDRYAPGRP